MKILFRVGFVNQKQDEGINIDSAGSAVAQGLIRFG